MPRKTLDELFRSGPPRRDSDDSRDELSEVEKQFILWGLKEKWELSRIAEALRGVDESAVLQFRTNLVRDPDVLLDLDVVEAIEDQGVTMFRCVACTVHLNSPDQIDRHALAHFLDDSDLDSADCGTPEVESSACPVLGRPLGSGRFGRISGGGDR